MAERGKTGARGVRGDTGVRGDPGDEGRPGSPGGQGVVGKTGPSGRVILPKGLVRFLVGAPVVLAVTMAVAFLLFSNAVTAAQRDGCERVNNLREVTAASLQDNIDTTTDQLKKKTLGPALEPFRKTIGKNNEQRKARIASLRNVAQDYPTKGEPYHVNCEAAYP